MASPVRRALGARDPNAPLSPVKPVSTKTPDLKAVVARTLDASILKSADESRKRPLEDAALSRPAELDASATHATKRPKQDTIPAPTTPAPVPPELATVSSEAQQATPPSTIPPTQAVAAAASPTLPPKSPPSQGLEEPCSQASTLADSVAETSYAETLRLRLRMAMFKVKTDQVSAPISRLEIGSPTPSTPKDTLHIKDPPADALRAYRRLPGSLHRRRHQPVARPRTPEYSVALQYAPHDMALPSRLEPGRNLPQASYARSSSPGCSDCEGHSGLTGDDARDAPATPASITIDRTAFSSPDDDFDKPEMNLAPFARMPERDVTSSAVKGSAADSLLRLGEGM